MIISRIKCYKQKFSSKVETSTRARCISAFLKGRHHQLTVRTTRIINVYTHEPDLSLTMIHLVIPLPSVFVISNEIKKF